MGISIDIPKIHPGCLTSVEELKKNGFKADSLFIDGNQLIYSSVRIVHKRMNSSKKLRGNLKDNLMFPFFELLEKIHTEFQPKKLMIALDGPAPLSKLLEQRSRRLKSCSKMEREMIKMGNDVEMGAEKELIRLMATPGTETMHSIYRSLCFWASRNIKNDNCIIVSGAESPGEGEFKIFQSIANEPDVEENIVVQGLDSDLVLFGLLAPPKKHVMIWNPHIGVISIDKLKETIMDGIPRELESRVIHDLCLIALFGGNDYLPRLKGFNAERSWRNYIEARRRTPELPFLFDPLSKTVNVDQVLAIIGLNRISTSNNTNDINAKQIMSNIYYTWLPSNMNQDHYISSQRNKDKCHLELKIGDFNIKKECSSFDLSRQIERMTHDALFDPKFMQMIRNITNESVEKQCKEIIYKYVNRTQDKTLLETIPKEWINEAQAHLKLQEKDTTLNLSKNEIAKKYFEGLVWNMEYLKGDCLDYHYHFPSSVISPSDLNTDQVNPTFTNKQNLPMKPLQFAMCVLPAKFFGKVIHPIYEKIAMEPPFKDIYFSKNGKAKEWNHSSLDTNVQSIIKHTNDNTFIVPKEILKLTRFTYPLLFRSAREKDPKNWEFSFPSPSIRIPYWMKAAPSRPIVCLSGNKHGFSFSQNQYSRRIEQKAGLSTLIRRIARFR